MEFNFKNENSDVAERKKSCEMLLKKYPTKIPIIFEKDIKCNIKEMQKNKYLISKDMTVNHFMALKKKKMKLESSSAFFILVNGKYSIIGEKKI